MHTVLFLSSMLTAMLAGRMLVGLADRAVDWRPRRTLQFLALAVPVLGLSFNLLGLHHFTVGSCFLGMPPWDYVLGAGLPVITAVVTVAALTAAFVRLLLLRRFVAGQGLPAGPLLQARVSRLAADLNAPIPEVRVCPLDRPLALSWGFPAPAYSCRPGCCNISMSTSWKQCWPMS